MTVSTSKKAALALLAAGTAIALAGCSGGSEPGNGAPAGAQSQDALFEFQTSSYGSATDGNLTIRVPEALVEAAGSDADGLLVTEYRTSPHELGGAKYCGIDVQVTYADKSAQESAGQTSVDDASVQAAIDEAEARVYRVFKVEDQAELTRWFEQKIAEGGLTVDTLTPEQLDNPYLMEFGLMVVEDVKSGMPVNAAVQALLDFQTEGFRKKADDQAALAPAALYGQALAATTSARPLADLDEADPEDGLYVSDDGSELTYVVECAADPSDDDDTAYLRFPLRVDGEIESFASVDLVTMKSGSVVVLDSEVSGYAVDSQGNWIAN